MAFSILSWPFQDVNDIEDDKEDDLHMYYVIIQMQSIQNSK